MNVKERQLAALRCRRSSSTTLDLLKLRLRELELERELHRAQIGPDLIFIDYQDTVLTRRIEETREHYDKMGKVFEELRRLAIDLNRTFIFH